MEYSIDDLWSDATKREKTFTLTKLNGRINN